MSVVMHNKDSFDGAAHTEVFIVVLETLKTCRYGRVLFRLCLFCAGIRNLELIAANSHHNSPKGKVR